MIVDVYVREYDDTWDSAEKHGFINTEEIWELMRLLEKQGIVRRDDRSEDDGEELTATGQFIFDAPKNKLYFELSFGVE